MRPSLEDTIALAAKAHVGQVDKGGAPYILHPLRVMLAVDADETARMVAVLHDVVEDTSVTLEQLYFLGYSSLVVMAVDHLSRRPRMGYDEYIERLCAGPPVALHVKLADLLDNMDRSRIPNPTERDQQRWAKYTDTWHRIHRAFRSAW
ncbi:hypothetical protein LCGC14_1830400 [marine sediment metagenome]|uniref:HD domain-containing protein n=1 Tax=marine sediment metagenome TaxID=412755 RepID=A0A0F9IVV3_9ZZZZ